MDRGVASGRPARNETRHVWGGKKKGSGAEKHGNDTGTHDRHRQDRPAEIGQAGGAGRAPTGAQRGLQTSTPPHDRRLGNGGSGGRRVMESEGEPPERPTSLRAPPPPDPGGGRATPPGVFKPPRRNATARYPGQERGGHARPEKRGIGTGEPTRDTHIPPHATTAPANVEKPEPRRGWVPGEQSARPDDRTPPGRVKNP